MCAARLCALRAYVRGAPMCAARLCARRAYVRGAPMCAVHLRGAFFCAARLCARRANVRGALRCAARYCVRRAYVRGALMCAAHFFARRAKPPGDTWKLISRLRTPNKILQFIADVAEHISLQEQRIHSELYGCVEEQNTDLAKLPSNIGWDV
uniref:Uncharacterized protein n=1 Tax=Globodera rostochiensis TaxID=31243 RepID=A0A914IE81_GLORO